MPFFKIIYLKMKRRNFVKGVAAGSLGAATLGTAEARNSSKENVGKRKVLMKVGCQSGGTSIKNLEFKARHGVFNIDGGSPEIIEGVGWDLEDSLRKKEACEKYGISLDAYHLPLTSAGIDRVKYPNMMLGKSPERDREIEIIQQMIEVAAKTDVHVLNYNTTIHRVLRVEPTVDPKRGNAIYSTWNYEEAVKLNRPKTIAGDVSVDEVFDRIAYVLERIIPVAEEYKVKLANHIADPPTPVGYRGITRWNSPDVFAGMKRFAELSDSSYHGFNFCIGSIAEGLKDPKTEIIPIIKYFGERNQIFNVHYRNIKGGWNNFMEVFPDNGDMDFLEVIRALRDVGYDGMVMPDHVPKHEAEGARDQAFAFVYGYIIAMLQVVKSEEVS